MNWNDFKEAIGILLLIIWIGAFVIAPEEEDEQDEE